MCAMWIRQTRWVLAGALALGMAGPLWAQTTRPAAVRERPMLVDRLQEALEKLDLTGSQRQETDTILAQARDQAQQMREELRDATPQERREKVQAFAQDLRQKLGAVLTDEQEQQLREALPGPGPMGPGGDRPMMGRRGEASPMGARQWQGKGPGPMEPGARLRKALEQLNLTEDQKAKIDAIVEDARKQGEELRKQVHQLMVQTHQQVEQQLTPEQQEQFRKLLPAPPAEPRPRGEDGSTPPPPPQE